MEIKYEQIIGKKESLRHVFGFSIDVNSIDKIIEKNNPKTLLEEIEKYTKKSGSVNFFLFAKRLTIYTINVFIFGEELAYLVSCHRRHIHLGFGTAGP